MKAFAAIGVLREFAKARIPVHAVVGIEWGAVIGGLYASQGQANDAEWKGFKLRDQDLPTVGGFLSSKISAQSVGVLTGFFDTTFGNVLIENARVDFACPAYWSRVDRFGWMSKGSMREAMRACLPYPPFFTDNSGVWAAPFAIDEAAAHLRSRGANLIILVNVLGSGEFFPTKLALGEHAAENLLWSEIRRELLSAKPPTVHLTINVNTAGHPLTDLTGRRALLDRGSRAAGDVVQKLVSQYGF
jgi:predicted acylesterase/phospholipase RssA